MTTAACAKPRSLRLRSLVSIACLSLADRIFASSMTGLFRISLSAATGAWVDCLGVLVVWVLAVAVA